AQYQRDALVRDVAEIAGKAWNAFTLGVERYELLQQQERAAGRIVSNYREEYSLSKRSLLDVLDAERARFNTGFQRISALAAARFAQYRMLAVQSRLVDYFGAQPAVHIRKPNFESQVRGKPLQVFDITIDPLR
ncbi:MAG: TolC family protein, partial [Pseudomonadota bacterium]